MKNNHISEKIMTFHGRTAPEEGWLVGYGALINAYDLSVPLPDRLSLINPKHKIYSLPQWMVFTPRYEPKDNLYGHLVFALKHEGVELHVLKSLFSKISGSDIKKIITLEPTGQYSRKIWFLYEWLMDKTLSIPDLKIGNFVDLIDPKLQYPGPSQNSKRHRIRNNLPGVRNFCPLIRRTKELDRYISLNLSNRTKNSLKRIHKDILKRTSAFLLLKDSKASYNIEGERPTLNRVQRWGKAIGQAGQRKLSEEELLRLQQIIIEDARFIQLGLRKQEGFVGEHDRLTGEPIPDHISAKWKDLEILINGLVETDSKLKDSDYDAVLAATLIAFGFVFIHPFIDGNGRIHRYLIHHVLATKNFAPKGIIFPVSFAILDRIDEYREVLEAHALPRLDLIQWKKTPKNNVEILNDTIDLYRYFDATKQAEFIYSCVEETINKIIPEEISYLSNYDKMKAFLDDRFEIPDRSVALLIRFLQQGNGSLSKRARQKEFKNFNDREIKSIQSAYKNIFKI